MSPSDPGLIVVHFFRKLDSELVHKNPADEKVMRFYSLFTDILRPFAILPIFQSQSSESVRTKQIGKGRNDRWEVKVYELENDVVVLAKFTKPIRRDLCEKLRSKQDFNPYKVFFADELSSILFDHFDANDVQSSWKELIYLSPSTQQTLIFDIPFSSPIECDQYVADQGLVEPRFTGCYFSSIGDQNIYVSRMTPVTEQSGHRREFLWMVYPNINVVNQDFGRLCWSPFAENTLPLFVRFLCDLTRCTCCHESAMIFKQKLESLQMLVLEGTAARPEMQQGDATAPLRTGS